ncbi:hypothetical protein [Methanocella arvoryzae]|uniref:DUF3899 domain-containing protein n=1 Tax=Methanocella arvoryzae (strain DSM 22066 / NBRC 105507 / MRE50) TaxID=351160 RepID=Q0W8W2_METAR|nr:hypothetical protein [Methanocella arvoryzae]CAJ35181.1 hypothetical protein LRC177 [Methanocella arvoryzae MRE50]
MTLQRLMPFISMFIYSLIIVVASLLLAGLYIILTGGGNLIVALSNLLFIESGIILLIGASIEFFHLAGRDDRVVVSTKVLFPIRAGESKADAHNVELHNPGWLLIFLGALLFAYSLTLVLLFAK